MSCCSRSAAPTSTWAATARRSPRGRRRAARRPRRCRCRAKELHTIGRADGRLLSHVGLTLAVVEIAGAPFVVVGVGAVIVTWSERGRGRLRPVLEAALERAEALG